MATPRQIALRRLVLVLDALLLVAAVPLAAWGHHTARGVVPFVRELASPDQLVVLPFIVVPIFLVLLAGFGLDDLDRRWGRGELFRTLLKVHLSLFLILAVIVFISQTVVNRSLAALYLTLSFVLLYAERSLLLRWRRGRYERGETRERILLVGTASAEMGRFVTQATGTAMPPSFVGLLAEGAGLDGVRLLGTPERLSEILHAEAVDRVLFFPPYHRPDEAAALLDACETVGIPAEFLVELPRPSLAQPRIVSDFDKPFVSFDVAPKAPEALAIKHAMDVLVAAVVLVLASPILILSALAILITMGRPIFFVQERAGLFGRTFRMRKFRTMKVGAEAMRDELVVHNEAGGPVFKMTNDPRVTPLGRLLRKTSIDELPQLFHVLAGTMSLVGPRPLPVKEQASIRGWHRRRLSMKPGITGLWQVSGRSNLTFDDWMKLDLEYVDRWSLGLDFKLLLKTLPVVLLGRGAR